MERHEHPLSRAIPLGIAPRTESLFYSHAYAEDRTTAHIARRFAYLVEIASPSPERAGQSPRVTDWIVAVYLPILRIVQTAITLFACMSMLVLLAYAADPTPNQDLSKPFDQHGYIMAIAVFTFLLWLMLAATKVYAGQRVFFFPDEEVRAKLFAPLLAIRPAGTDAPVWSARDTVRAAAQTMIGPLLATVLLAAMGTINVQAHFTPVGVIVATTLWAIAMTVAVLTLMGATIYTLRVVITSVRLTRLVTGHNIRAVTTEVTTTHIQQVYSAEGDRIVAVAIMPTRTLWTMGHRECHDLNETRATVVDTHTLYSRPSMRISDHPGKPSYPTETVLFNNQPTPAA